MHIGLNPSKKRESHYKFKPSLEPIIMILGGPAAPSLPVLPASMVQMDF